MAQGDDSARRRTARRTGQGSATLDAVRRLEGERDALKAELAAALARVAVLERQRADAINRMDWVIDSLHSMLEAEC